MGPFVNFGQFSIQNPTHFSRTFGAKTSLTVVYNSCWLRDIDEINMIDILSNLTFWYGRKRDQYYHYGKYPDSIETLYITPERRDTFTNTRVKFENKRFPSQ